MKPHLFNNDQSANRYTTPAGCLLPGIHSTVSALDSVQIMESMMPLRGRIPSVLFAALVLALTRLQFTGAVDVLFWSQANCRGASVGCTALAEGVCCGLAAASWRTSMQIRNSDSCKSTRIYTGGFCASEWGRFNNNFCVSGARFTGGKWFNICRRRQLLADVAEHEPQACLDGSTSCTKLMDPNAVLYNSGEGIWVLIKDNILGLYEQLMNLPDSQKVAWLTAQGATYKSGTDKEMIVVAN
ncbi:hypothetical protein Mapa_013152 [Marchantia paleacea]|nr:hypothetical protein Mapa_013152 [Marchantia paleacea]